MPLTKAQAQSEFDALYAAYRQASYCAVQWARNKFRREQTCGCHCTQCCQHMPSTSVRLSPELQARWDLLAGVLAQ